MSISVAGPISAYLNAKNERDVDAMMAQFDDHACVKDEGHEHDGLPAIRSWLEGVTRKFSVAVDVQDVTDSSGRTIVSAIVSGDFPGSPVPLNFTFTLSGSKIARLEMG